MKRNVILGAFVIVGTLIFVSVLYYLGARQNLFGSSLNVYVFFNNVNGLQRGNNVRFSGISIGAVRDLEIVNDSSVKVTISVSEDVAHFIKKDSKASIGSEGLMGNMVVNLSSGSIGMRSITKGDTIPSEAPVGVDELMSVFRETGKNAQSITKDLSEMTALIKSGEGTLGKLIADTNVANRFEKTISSIEKTGNNFSEISENFAGISRKAAKGEGTLGRLMVDETIADNLNSAVDSLKVAGEKSVQFTENIMEFTEKLNNPNGPLGKLLTDTTMAETLDETVTSANRTTAEAELMLNRVKNSRIMNFLFGTKGD